MTTLARHPSADSQTARSGERGFTLIELSIVLVIIGLLIGGILQGQEMINNTRLKSTVAQVDAITAAAQTFQDKYRALPGDAPAAVATVLGGVAGAGTNGDGIIGATAAGNASVAEGAAIVVSSGAALAMNHLDLAGLLQGVEDVGGAGTFFTLPATIDQGNLDLATFAFAAAGDDRVAVRVRGAAVAGAAPAAGLIPRDAMSLDTKYDDGQPLTGRWRSATNAALCHNNAAAPGTAYAPGTAVGCMMLMSIR